MSRQFAQVKKAVRDCIDTDSIAKKLVDMGFVLPDNKKVQLAGSDFFVLKNDVNRMKKLSDGWTRDEFLSMLHKRKVEIAPESLDKHIPWKESRVYAATFSDKNYISRMFNVFEWETIRDRTKYDPAIIDAAKALNLKTDDWYWTDEGVAGNPGNAWCVVVKNGSVSWDSKDNELYVRPVRLSQ